MKLRKFIGIFLLGCISTAAGWSEDYASWKLELSIEVEGLQPDAIQWALYEKDPQSYFLKGMQAKIDTLNNKMSKELDPTTKIAMRNQFIILNWEKIFAEVTGDQVYLLPGKEKVVYQFKSKSLNTRKWVTTKMVVVKGQVLCWRIGVKPQEGQTSKIVLTRENAYQFKNVWPVSQLIRDFAGESLIQAIQQDKLDLIEGLIQQGASVNAKDDNEISVLQWTAYKDNLELFRRFIKQGADLDYRNHMGFDIRDIVVLMGSRKIFEYMVDELHFNPVESNSWGIPPLHLAALTGELNMVKLLVEKYNMDVNGTDSRGFTPLHYASAGQDDLVMRYLLEKGALVNKANERGLTPLMVYAQPNLINDGLMKILFYHIYINSRGNIEYYNFNDSFNVNKKYLLHVLLNAGADINAQDKKGWTVLHYGVGFFDQYWVKYLLEKGADKNIKSTGSRGSIPAKSRPYDALKKYIEIMEEKKAPQFLLDKAQETLSLVK